MFLPLQKREQASPKSLAKTITTEVRSAFKPVHQQTHQGVCAKIKERKYRLANLCITKVT